MSITRGVFYAFLLLVAIYSSNLFYSYRSLKAVAELTLTIYCHPLVVSNAANQVCGDIVKAHARLHDMIHDKIGRASCRERVS
jgi:hypothetical protein